MVGFPGETESEFKESVDFIERMPLTYLHVFTYSERPGTKAVELEAPVPMDVRRERNRVLQELSARKNRDFRKSLIGKRFSGVTISDLGVVLTTNYVRVELQQPRPRREWMEVELGSVSERGMREASPLLVLS